MYKLRLSVRHKNTAYTCRRIDYLKIVPAAAHKNSH